MSRFHADDRGNMAILFALAFSLLGVAAAISIDSASLYHERRMMQAAVDLAALTAAAHPQEAEAIAEAVLADAGFGNATRLAVTLGRYEPNPSLAPAARFAAGATAYNAVQVALERPGRLYFGTSFSEAPMVGAKGLAMVEPEVSFSVGSGLASLNNGVANALLGTLLGTTVSLSVANYTGLANARVGALDFLDALALELGVTAGTYSDLLASEAHAGDIAAALARLVNGAEKTALTTLALAGDGSRVPLGKLFNLGKLGGLAINTADTALVGAQLSVLDVLSAAAALADGSRQVGLTLAGGLPGITSVSASLAMGEPPQGGGWYAVGPAGQVVRTAQLRLRLDITVGGKIGGNIIHLPIWVSLAHAEARVASATCPSEDNPFGTARIAVLPGAAQLAIGQVTNAQLRNFGAPLAVTPATLVDVLLLKILASAHANVAQATPIALNFSSSEIERGTLKTARTTGLATSLTQSLLNSLTVQVPILGLGLGLTLGGVGPTLLGILTPLTAPIDTLLDGLLSTLGLGIGEADVRVYGVRCARPVLVG